MISEAPLETTENGAFPTGAGWFVINVRDAQWLDGGRRGRWTFFEGANARFEELGVGIGMLRPGEANARYHGEGAQECFLVLAGECLLLIQGEERRLGVWDFVHCPPWAEHAFVGAGDRPCLLLAVGARLEGLEARGVRFPVSEIALRYGAGVEAETRDPREAYAGFTKPEAVSCPSEFRDLTP